MKRVCTLLLVVTTLALLCFASSTASESYSSALLECVHKCSKKVEHQDLCKSTCEHRLSLPNLEVLVDGERVGPKDMPMSDNSFEVNNVNFDRSFYNTPGAFSDILEFKGELMNQFYHQAASKFNTPGHGYHHGTMLHLLNVPIPLTDAQFNNQEFMNKLIDVVPRSEGEYKPVSPLPLSDSYREFLLSVKVDPNHLQDAPSNPDVRANIDNREQHLENVLNEYMVHAERCYNDYQTHISQNQLSPISYTLEHYSQQNEHCRISDAKLAEHERLSKELADYLQSLNPYNELFMAISRTSMEKYNWNYARDQIEAFTNHHRNLEAQGIDPADSKYEIPVTIKRSFFNHQYFGQSGTFSESNVDAHLTFSGLGWKESPIAPDSWFNMYAIHKFMHHPQSHGKNFFGENGLLNRIPTYMLIAFKPVLKVKISRQMKEGFTDIASKHQLRPLETGCFCYTRVEIVTNNGGQLNEEYEMILSSTINHPQIIAFKSTPAVHIPSPGAPALPEYFKYMDKRVIIRSVHGTHVKTEHGGDTSPLVAQSHLDGHATYVVKNAGENKVFIESALGNRLRCHPGASADGSVHLGDWEKFILIKSDDRWVIKSAHGTYLRAHGGERGLVDCSPHLGDWEKFTIDIVADSYQYLERRVALRSVHGTYIRFENPHDTSPLVAQRDLDGQSVYTVKNAGDGNRVFLENALGTRLRCHQGGGADGSVHWGDWEKFEMVPTEGRWAFKSVHGTFIRPHGGDRGTVDCSPHLGDWEKVFVDLVPWHYVFLDRQVGFKSVHGSYLRAFEDGEGKNIVTQGHLDRDEKWIVRNAGNNRVYIMNSFGLYMRCHPGDRADNSPHLGGWEQFEMIPAGDKWLLKSAHGTYVRAHPNVGSVVDCSPHMGDWERFYIEPQPMPLHVKYLNKVVGIKTAHNTYIIAHQGEGAKAGQTPGLNDWERFRVVYTGYETVAFLSHHGTYLRAPPDRHERQCKRSGLFGMNKKCWDNHYPSRALTASGIDNCTKFRLIPTDDGRIALQTVCEGRYLLAYDNGEVGLQTAIGGWERFDLVIVR